jgi:hypothetical protein
VISPDSSEGFSTSSLYSQTDPSEENAFQLVSEKLIPSLKREKDGKEAMFRVKLLELRDGGGVLSFQINHALADGCAVFHFINNWARSSSSSSSSSCPFASLCCSSSRVRTLGGLCSSKWNPRLEKRITREELQPLGWYLLNAEDEIEKKVETEEKTALEFSIPEVMNFRISRKTIESCKSLLFSDPQFGEGLRTSRVLSTNDIVCAILYWTFAKFHVDEQKERRKGSSSSSSSKPLSLNIVWNFREVCPEQQQEGGNTDFQDFGNFTSWAFVSMPREEVLRKTIAELALIIRKSVERCCTLEAAQKFSTCSLFPSFLSFHSPSDFSSGCSSLFSFSSSLACSAACCAQQYAQKGVEYTPDVSPLIPGAQLGDVLFVTNWTKFTNMWDNDFGTGKPFGVRAGPPSFLGMIRVLPVPTGVPVPKDLDWKKREEEGGTEWTVPFPEGTKKGLEELGIDLQKLQEVIKFVQKHAQ